MDYKIKCLVNNQESSVKLTEEYLLFDSFKVFYNEITSVQIKNTDFFYLKINTSDQFIIKFTSMHTRDLFKSICSTVNHPDLKYFADWPVLLKIFEELNVSLTQFISYLKSSYFFNIKNEKNVIDRMIGNLCKNENNNFASRINNHSIISLNNEEIEYIPTQFIEKKIDFTPIFPLKNEEKEKPKLNSFTFQTYQHINFDLSNTNLESKRKPEFLKSDLERLLKNKRNQIEDNEFITSLEKKYGKDKMSYLKRLLPKNYN